MPALLVGCNFEARVGLDEGSSEAAAGQVGDDDVRVGDCFTDDDPNAEQGNEFSSVNAVRCDEPHNYEVYAIFDLPAGDYPDDDELIRHGHEGCVERFTDFAGVAYEQTSLDVTFRYPSRQSWESLGDRAVTCAFSNLVGQMEGSVAGAGRQYAARLRRSLHGPPTPNSGLCRRARG